MQVQYTFRRFIGVTQLDIGKASNYLGSVSGDTSGGNSQWCAHRTHSHGDGLGPFVYDSEAFFRHVKLDIEVV